MEYKEIKNKREKDMNELFKKLGVFWAFSNSQFDENKTPLMEGEKYIDIGAGGFMPKHNFEALTLGIKEIEKTFKTQIAENKAREKHILYELNNHECFYTGDTEDALDVLGADYTKEEVQIVYKKYKAQKYARPTLASDYLTQ